VFTAVVQRCLIVLLQLEHLGELLMDAGGIGQKPQPKQLRQMALEQRSGIIELTEVAVAADDGWQQFGNGAVAEALV
jgi:hypothetical protein